MEYVRTFEEFTYTETLFSKLRNRVRNAAIWGLALRANINSSTNWIRFPYYHHVFDDERKDFERQLKYFRNFGEFISIDDVYKLLNSGDSIDGRYFCLSFDDGYRCLYSNMMPITVAFQIPVVIYLPTDYINTDANDEKDFILIKDNLPGNPRLLSFLNWVQCRQMLNNQISFGSHTKSHANLSGLAMNAIEYEMRFSKDTIEANLGVPCVHFSCPWGRSYINFNPAITTPIAKKQGYKTFTTTDRGKTNSADDLYRLKRDHVLARWGNDQLKYFFSR